MEMLTRGLRFIGRYITKDPFYLCTYIAVVGRKDFRVPTRLYEKNGFIDELKKGRSLIRIGDGEINLLLGLRNHYHTFSPVLRRRFFQIVRGYDEISPYLLAVPRFVNCTNVELKKMGKLQVWLPLKVVMWLYFNRRTAYVDAHAFYYDGFFEQTVGEYCRDKRVLLVTNAATIAKQRANHRLPWTLWHGIETPEAEAIGVSDQVRQQVVKYYDNYGGEQIVVLMAMGPVGKLLAHEFASSGIQTIDIGKVAEVMYTGESIEYIV